MWPVSDWWHPEREPRSRSVIEIYSDGVWQGSTTEIIGGSVTEKNVNGPRSSLALEVEPSQQWLRWLSLPAVELVVWDGFVWGTREELLPMGVFPVSPVGESKPAKTLQITAPDHWVDVAEADLYEPRTSYLGFVHDNIARLIGEVYSTRLKHPVTGVDLRDPIIDVAPLRGDVLDTRDDWIPTPQQMWEHRAPACLSMADSISVEVFPNRWGQPVIRNRRDIIGREFTDSEQGTVFSVDSTIDWSDVYNTVILSSTNSTKAFAPIVRQITDPAHPAHKANLGRERVLQVSDNNVTTLDQGAVMAQTLLDRHAAPALAWGVKCLRDPSREPGDRALLGGGVLGPNRWVRSETIVHPLGPGVQTVTLGEPLDRD